MTARPLLDDTEPCADCGHTAAAHITQGAVARERGAWCGGCDDDATRTADDNLVHHDYRAQRALTTSPANDPHAALIRAAQDARAALRPYIVDTTRPVDDRDAVLAVAALDAALRAYE